MFKTYLDSTNKLFSPLVRSVLNLLVLMQGEAVTLAELGEYTRAASLLEDLIKVGTL